jgi:DNA-binding NtrC family response regulator
MTSSIHCTGRLPIVLVVDPVAASRFTLWRALGRRFGVLEAEDARGARAWLASRDAIDILLAQRELPDADGGAFVDSLATASPRARVQRALVLDRGDNVLTIVAQLTRWFHPSSWREGEVDVRRRLRWP